MCQDTACAFNANLEGIITEMHVVNLNLFQKKKKKTSNMRRDCCMDFMMWGGVGTIFALVNTADLNSFLKMIVIIPCFVGEVNPHRALQKHSYPHFLGGDCL